MEMELGRGVNHTEVWLDTHKPKNGTHVNEDARNIFEQVIHEMMSQNSSSQSQIASQDDDLGKVFGKEHSGRVRGLGFGACPSIAFRNTTSRANVMQWPSSDGPTKEYVASLEKELAATKSQAQEQNILIEDMKKTFGGALVTVFENALGKVPEQLTTWLNRPFERVPDEGSGHQPSPGNGRRYSSSSHDVNEHSPSS